MIKFGIVLLSSLLVMLISFLISFIYSQVMLNAASGERIEAIALSVIFFKEKIKKC